MLLQIKGLMELFKGLFFVGEPADPVGPDKGQRDG